MFLGALFDRTSDGRHFTLELRIGPVDIRGVDDRSLPNLKFGCRTLPDLVTLHQLPPCPGRPPDGRSTHAVHRNSRPGGKCLDFGVGRFSLFSCVCSVSIMASTSGRAASDRVERRPIAQREIPRYPRETKALSGIPFRRYPTIRPTPLHHGPLRQCCQSHFPLSLIYLNPSLDCPRYPT